MRDRAELGGFGLSAPLAARIGALLAKKVDLTAGVLALARPGTALESALLDPELLKSAGRLTTRSLGKILERHGASGVALVVRSRKVRKGRSSSTRRTVATEAEVAGARAAGKKRTGRRARAKKAGLPEKAVPAAPGGLAPVGLTLGPAAAALFPPEEIARLKLVVLTSARREEKIEAMRKLALAPIPEEEKAQVFLSCLSGPDSEVRAESARLLRPLGLNPELAEAVRDLESGEDRQRSLAVDRIGKRLASGAPVEVGASLIALIGRLREEASPEIKRHIMEKLGEAAEVIAGAGERPEELAKLVLGLVASRYVDMASPARALLKRLGSLLPERMRGILWTEHEATGDRLARGFVLQVLAVLPGAASDGKLASSLAEAVARAREDEADFRLLGDLLIRMGDRGVRALIGAFGRAHRSQQRYIVRLLGDACRFAEVTTEVKEEVALLYLSVLEGGHKEVQMPVLEAQLPQDRDLSDDTRRRLAEAFLSRVSLFVFPADVDNVEHTVARTGLPAAEVLLQRLGAHLPDAERVRAVRMLGELGRVEGERKDPAVREKLLDVLRTLQRMSVEGFPDTPALLLAMGKIASTPAMSPDTVELIARNLMERRGGGEPGFGAYEALGFIASSPYIYPERAEAVEKLFVSQLEAEPPELSTTERFEDDVSVIEIGGEAALYTDAVPAAIKGLVRMALSASISRGDPARTARTVEYLLGKWEALSRGEDQWGPPGATALVGAMREIGSSPSVDLRLRLKVIKALAKRLPGGPALEALGEVFAAEDRSVDIGRLAAGVGVALMRRRGPEGRFPEEDRELILKVLGAIAARRTLDTSSPITAHLREDVVEELFTGVRDGVTGAYEALAALRRKEALPEGFRGAVQRRLSAYESIVPRGEDAGG